MGKWIYGWKSLKYISEHGFASRELPNGIHYDYALALDIIPRCLGVAFTPDSEFPEKYIKEIGYKWIYEHIFSRNPQTPYFRSRPKNGAEFDLHYMRVTDFSELLYNLQTVIGIEAVYRRLVSNPSQIEATILELEGFRLLWLAGLHFKIVHAGAGQNLNYECEITLPSGATAYCEMKCKLETTKFSESSLKNALDGARHQLPKGCCGIILVKIPQTWVEGSDNIASSINAVIGKILNNTTRVCEIVWYATFVKSSSEWSFGLHMLNEYLNDKAPNAKDLNGGIFHDGLRTTGETRWVHLFRITKEQLQKILAIELKNSL
jgi:hypothetical protein